MKMEEVGEETVYKFEVDLSEKEVDTLLRYADLSIDSKELNEMLIEWAIIDLLKKEFR